MRYKNCGIKSARKILADRVGFEPTVRCRITGFQDRLLKPLGHLSNIYICFIFCRLCFSPDDLIILAHFYSFVKRFSRFFQKNFPMLFKHRNFGKWCGYFLLFILTLPCFHLCLLNKKITLSAYDKNNLL